MRGYCRALIAALGLGGCAVDALDEEPVAATAQPYTYDYSIGWPDQVVGVEWHENVDLFYFWYDDGTACTDGHARLGCRTFFNYSVPGGAFTSVRGIAVDQVRRRVLAWYSDSTVSEGLTTNFSHYTGKRTFTRPRKPSGALFSMSELIDVTANSFYFNGTLYSGDYWYYWKDGTRVYRTVGSATNAASSGGAQLVNAATDQGPIVGIGLLPMGSSMWLYTYYGGGYQNVSFDPLDLDAY